MKLIRMWMSSVVQLFLILSLLPGSEEKRNLLSYETTTTPKPAVKVDLPPSKDENTSRLQNRCSGGCIASIFFGLLALICLCMWVGTAVFQRYYQTGIYRFPPSTIPKFQELGDGRGDYEKILVESK